MMFSKKNGAWQIRCQYRIPSVIPFFPATYKFVYSRTVYTDKTRAELEMDGEIRGNYRMSRDYSGQNFVDAVLIRVTIL